VRVSETPANEANSPGTGQPAASPARSPSRDPVTERRRDVFVVVLAFVSGYTDGVGFLALGGAFTSVMTGNMVLLGLSAGDGNLQGVGRAVGAILAFTAGCAIGTQVAGVAAKGDPVWPAKVNRGLAAETAIVVATGIGWVATGGSPRPAVQFALLLASAVALGIQSSTVQRFGVSGLSTTYLTGTLTTAVIHLVSHRTVRGSGRNWRIMGALIVGAAAAAGLHQLYKPALPAPQVLGLAVVLIAGARLARQEPAPMRA
jgi:uncharacterized membrane protein YoaK (UPF0700 family)